MNKRILYVCTVLFLIILLCSGCTYKPIIVAQAEQLSPKGKTKDAEKSISTPTNTPTQDPTITPTLTNTPTSADTPTSNPTPTPTPGKVTEILQPEGIYCPFDKVENFSFLLGPGSSGVRLGNVWVVEIPLISETVHIEEGYSGMIYVSTISNGRTFAIKTLGGQIFVLKFETDTGSRSLGYAAGIDGKQGEFIIPPRTSPCVGNKTLQTGFISWIIVTNKEAGAYQEWKRTCEESHADPKPYLLPNGKYYTWQGCPILEIWEVP